MPRKVALLAVLACLAAAAPASAEVVANQDANQVASALAEPLGGAYAGAAWALRPGGGEPSAVGTTPLAAFPTAGTSFAVLSSGDATLADDPAGPLASVANDGGGGTHGDTIADLVSLRVDLRVPAGVNCLRTDMRFLSEEYPDFVGGTYNDAVIVELDTSDFTSAADYTVTAPNNFAFDSTGRQITINTATFAPGEAAGTTYNGATATLRASTPIGPGAHSVYVSVFDQNDAGYDSTVFIDAMRLEATDSCVRGATADVVAPAPSIGAPTGGSTITGAPTYSGTAGDAPGDNPQVTVRTTSSTGQTVEAVATRAGAGWSVAGAALAPGTYTAVAIQGDASGNVGQSAPVTFTVAAPVTPPSGPPAPVTGKAVNVAVVKGKVRIRRPGGKFRTLTDASQIPTGSTVDTRNGTVELTSTAKGGKTQKAKFFQGMFKVTQSRGKNPLTTLTLNEPLAKCPSKKASSSQRKKKRKRRLWGDGRGNFRTSGRRSAATVSGTKWLVEDTCKGTMTRVVRGTVKVRDYKKKKTVKVKAGKRYMAR